MKRRVATTLVAGLMLVLTAASIVVIGIRTKYPPVLNRIRRFNRDVGNPRQIRSAGTPGSSASILRHTGRKSNKQYETPVTAAWTADGFLIGLPYGPNTDWLKNVLAGGAATLINQGHSYQCDEPELVPITKALPDFPASERRALRLMGVDECLYLRRASTADTP